jgi:hypothetical protein
MKKKIFFLAWSLDARGDSSPICKRHLESMLKGIKSYMCLVQTGHVDIEEFLCGRKGERHTTCNIVWNMERDQSFLRVQIR